jgi:hypothetical protein
MVSLEGRAVHEWIRLNLFDSMFCIGVNEFKDGVCVLGGKRIPYFSSKGTSE